MSKLRTMSYGGGVQSTACLVLAAQGKIDFKTFLFANVGDDSEDPVTLKYLEEVAKPYAKAEGIELVELRRIRRGGDEETLYQNVTRTDLRAINIPVRMSNGAPGNRHCPYCATRRSMGPRKTTRLSTDLGSLSTRPIE